MKTVEVKCSVCGTHVSRCSSEVNRSRRLGRRDFCSRRCSGVGNAKNLPRSKPGVVPRSLRGKAANRLDCHSPFRRHLANARRRHKAVTVTLEDLKRQWERQKGLCPYTGWVLDNPATTNEEPAHHTRRASLDRIDSDKGYEPGNIQFVALIAQYAKHRFEEEDLVEFCQAVVDQVANRATGQE